MSISICLGPIPAHLASFDWYAPHQAWIRDCGLSHHDPRDAAAKRADLLGADLLGADLTGAVLVWADLRGAVLTGANLNDADLTDADLRGATMRDAVLRGAVLRGAVLTDADLSGAVLSGAYLRGATLTDADLFDATLPDGRTYEEWRRDPLAGLCTDPDSIARATAAWGGRSWKDCPMHAAHGWRGFHDAPEDVRALAVVFVALLDGGRLPAPGVTRG